VLDDVQLQFLLGSKDAASTRWKKGRLYASNVRGTHRSRLDDERMADISGTSIVKGHKEIEVLLPLIGDRTEGYIFRPIDALHYDKLRRATGAVHTKKTPSRAARDAERAKNPKRQVRECYDFAAYRNAVYRACDRAGVKRWFPYMLRHTGITRIGLEHGVEAAQHTAGHRDIKTTLRYFHGENEIAKRVALSRNKSAMVEATVEEIKPVSSAAKAKSKDAVIAELLREKQQLVEMLTQKNG